MKVQIINSSSNPLPQYATSKSAGVDLRADIGEPKYIGEGEISLIPTGLRIALPDGYEAQVRPRSGLALKHGITVLNTPGTIDADYRGEIGVILINHGSNVFTVNPGERIAQLVINKIEQAEWEEVTTLDETERGDGAYGHSGTI